MFHTCAHLLRPPDGRMKHVSAGSCVSMPSMSCSSSLQTQARPHSTPVNQPALNQLNQLNQLNHGEPTVAKAASMSTAPRAC